MIDSSDERKRIENYMRSLKQELANSTDAALTPASKISELDNFRGVYFIFTNLQDLPTHGKGKKSNFQVGDYKLIYIGMTGGSVKGRLSNHLVNSQLKGPVSMRLEKIALEKVREDHEPNLSYWGKVFLEDGTLDTEHVYRNGLHFADYPEDTFKFVGGDDRRLRCSSGRHRQARVRQATADSEVITTRKRQWTRSRTIQCSLSSSWKTS
jgi:hypothetical protein